MADQAKRMPRRWLYIPFAIAAVIVFAYFLLWRAGAVQMKAAAEAWVEDQRAAGLEVSHGAMKASGFPFFLRVEIEAPEIAAPDVWRWRGEELFLDALPYDLDKLIFSPEGEQILWADGYGEWRARAADIRASIERDSARGWRFAMNIDGGEAVSADNAARISLAALVADLAPAPDEPATLSLNLAAEGVKSMAAGHNYGPGDIRTMITLSHTDWLTPPAPAAQWRDAGGSLAITGLSAEFEDATLSLAGALNLDAASYPAGRLQAEIANPAGFAALLGQAGALSEQDAEAAAAGLTLMSFATGGKLSAPIEFKNGEAQIAGVKLADLPRVE